MSDWLEIIRRESDVVTSGRNLKSTLIATSYDPKKHQIKGILVPHGVETGWVPIATNSAGKNWGIMAGPEVGSADKLDGHQFDIDFENGDPNSPIARHRMFSSEDTPPEVQSGEVLLRSKEGASASLDKNGDLIVKNKNGVVSKMVGNDHIVKDHAGQTILISDGKIYLGGDKSAPAVMTAAGASTCVFAIINAVLQPET